MFSGRGHLFCFVFVLFCFVLFCFVLFCFVLFLLPLRGLPQWWLTKARRRQEPILNQVPGDQWLNFPSEGYEGNPSPQFLGQG